MSEINQEEIEKAADKLLVSMMEENSPKFLQFMLSCIARAMEDANATDMDLSCQLDIKEYRYKVDAKCRLKKLHQKKKASNE